MCGIAGILHFDGRALRPGLLEAMTRALQHRGPDGEGVRQWGSMGIGHRRLAIIDPATGQQPMSERTARCWITFNGEIYNYRELRRTLGAAGFKFLTQSDTEVVLNAWKMWGEDCVTRLRGMFAFAIVDLDSQCMFVARDHLGIKPFFFYLTDQTFCFGSEIQALYPVPDIDWQLDLDAIDEYLHLQYITAPRTAYQKIRKLRPGTRMTVHFDGTVDGPREYWDINFEPDHSLDEEQWLERIDAVLRDSVRAHLVADVPFGLFLSGGIDSSLVLSYMSELLPEPPITFTIGFAGWADSETGYAADIAGQRGAENVVDLVRPDVFDLLPGLVRHCGEPFGDSSLIPTWLVSRLARQRVPMVLSGDGGDEMFAGYNRYAAWRRWLEPSSRSPLRKLARSLASSALPGRFPAIEPTLQNWLFFNRRLAATDRRRVWRPELSRHVSVDHEIHRELFRSTGSMSTVNQVQYMDVRTYLPDDVLRKVDVASMYHGLEVRTPLVDHEVCEVAAQIPEALHFEHHGNRTRGKHLLRELMRRHFGGAALEREKSGFAMPLQHWTSGMKGLTEIASERFKDDCGPLADYFQSESMMRIVRRKEMKSVWVLLVLDEWLRQQEGLRDASIRSDHRALKVVGGSVVQS
jgi:asparagine synthase (glutamine-hydrolysing)